MIDDDHEDDLIFIPILLLVITSASRPLLYIGSINQAEFTSTACHPLSVNSVVLNVKDIYYKPSTLVPLSSDSLHFDSRDNALKYKIQSHTWNYVALVFSILIDWKL